MKSVLLVTLLFHLCISGTDAGYKDQNREKRILRKDLLKDYDNNVGPVRYTKDKRALRVWFALTVTKLVEVNTKEEYLKLDTFIYQRWKDEMLKWNLSQYGKTFRTWFSSNEIWVPDIALLNNADYSERLAGGRTKFLTNIMVRYQGQCFWLSPATFKSSCQQNVMTWPMDTQVCILTFGSFSYPTNNLVIGLIKEDDYKKGSISNGEWTIDSIEKYSGTTAFNSGNLEHNLSTVNYKVTLTRKPGYILFYLCPPAIVFVLLSTMSFFIPTESGERIGFITTILLALMVFLLVIPEYLPRTSDQLPILGILLMASMVFISGVLMATIIILFFYHCKGSPPVAIQTFFFPCKFSFKSKHRVVPIMVREANAENNEAMEMEEGVVSYQTKNVKQDQKEEDIAWQQISKKLNWMFFLFFVVVLFGIFVFIALHKSFMMIG